MLFNLIKIISLIISSFLLSSCFSRSEFHKYNLSNRQVYHSIYENYTNLQHISKLYGKPDYNKDDKIWFYNFNSYNYITNNLDQNLLILEFDQNQKVIDKKIYYYGNHYSATLR